MTILQLHYEASEERPWMRPGCAERNITFGVVKDTPRLDKKLCERYVEVNVTMW